MMRRLRGAALMRHLFPGVYGPDADAAPDPIDQLRADIAAKLEARRVVRRPPPVTKRFERARPMVERLRRDLAKTMEL